MASPVYAAPDAELSILSVALAPLAQPDTVPSSDAKMNLSP